MGGQTGATHDFEEHTGEVRLRLRAGSLAALFEEAARAVADLMYSGGPPGAAGPPVPVDARAADREALLAAWINELVFLSETQKCVWVEVRIERLSDTDLHAVVRGVEPQFLRTQVKGATLHDLHITENRSGSFEATLVLDV